jgi:methionine sulfoxide reductase heme-binding subunit
MTPSAPGNYVWWLAGRSAGMVAMLMIAGSVILGLAMAAREIPPRWRRDAIRLHQHIALIGLGAIAAHGALLAADPWLKAGARGILVPFAIGYRPLWTGLGIIGGYLAAILGLSFYVRRRIGVRLWRRMHRLTVVVYVLSLVHALGAGTDTSIPIVRYAVLASALPVLFLFALRMQRSGGRRGTPRAAADPAEAPAGRGTASREAAGAAPLGSPNGHSGAPPRALPRGSMKPSASRAG